jgi:hypothetical protein
VQPVCIVVPRVVGDPETFHQCNALSEHLPLVILVKGLFLLVVIDRSSVMSIKLLQKFHANHDQSDLSILNLFFWSCSQPFKLKQMSLLSMHCIECAFGKLD